MNKITRYLKVGMLALLLAYSVGVAHAQTYDPTTGQLITQATPTTATPGVPTTGAGGNAPTYLILLAGSALAVVSGLVYVRSATSSVRV